MKKPQTMRELRLISLCNVLVMMFFKIMLNRLKGCLNSIISDNQSVFNESRLLTNNALITFEVNHYMKRRTQRNKRIAGLKIDISKAYHRLEWSFVKNILENFGFHRISIDRVMQFIQSVSYTFTHNGAEFRTAIPQRGLREGHPIWPYIYILCAEGLSAIIKRNEEAHLLHVCTIARGAPVISHLLFTDDCYFFFRATRVEVNVMKRIMNRYAEISGQVINFDKSTVTFSPNTRELARIEV